MTEGTHKPLPAKEDWLPLDDDAGPALRLSAPEQQALLAQVLQRAQAQRPQPLARRRRLLWLVSGVGLLVSAAAAALAVHRYEPKTDVPAPVTSTEVAQAPQVRLPPPPAVSISLPEPSFAGRQASVAALASMRTVSVPTLVADKVARDRLEQANDLRRTHRYSEALNVYLGVVRDYPRSLQAQAARVAAADLLLDQLQDSEGALRLYVEAARQGGALAEEAAFGNARVYRQRGAIVKEREALQRFLKLFPRSPLSAGARDRVQTLGSP